VSDVRTLDDIVLSAKGTEAFVGTLLLAAASVSLLLGVIGVYGSVAQVVRRRTQEIGVRIALGAEPLEILQTVAALALTSVGAGAVAGLGLSYLTGKSLKSLLFGVQPADPLMFGSVAVVLLLASCTAALLAGVRAVRISPVVAMRVE
jgi:putative ABC transport system permease protein